jgi:fumarylacetoacetate (FAA) hydrolase
MKLVSYLKDDRDSLGLLVDDRIFDMEIVHPDLPNTMGMFLNYWEELAPVAAAGVDLVKDGRIKRERGLLVDKTQVLAPVPFPTSCRDAYAFRQHVATARKNRNLEMIPEFDEFPVFYFTNHLSIKGPGEVSCMPDHFEELDFELEVAIVIGRHGKNIKAEEADEYIAGLMIMNDWSARKLQREEMVLNLGPAKGKDFATTMGPWLVSLDELEPYETEAKEGHVGKTWNLKMSCRVNGMVVSEGNLADMNWTFAEIIERVSYGVDLHPGDIIGSGTVGTGCFLELNGTGKAGNAEFSEQWLQNGDEVELEVEALGILKNVIVAEETDWSILRQKNKGHGWKHHNKHHQ